VTDHIQQKFERFHQENPHVLTTLERLATEWFEYHDTVSVKMLWENMRWRLGIETQGEPFKLPNNYPSRYARLLIARHPEWAQRIRTCSLRAVAA
jgi:hypothetical protein